jgi:hypothetical protein
MSSIALPNIVTTRMIPYLPLGMENYNTDKTLFLFPKSPPPKVNSYVLQLIAPIWHCLSIIYKSKEWSEFVAKVLTQ